MFEFFLLIGITMLLGFAAVLIFERTKISQALLLMLFGILLGPVLHLVDYSQESLMRELSPLIGTLALVVLLFDGGITLNLFRVIRAVPRAFAFTLLSFAITAMAVCLLMNFAFGWDYLYGLLLGAVVGGTSSAIVIAMVQKSAADEDIRALLTLESTITDALCIISAFLILQLLQAKEASILVAANLLLSAFSIATFLGVLGAIGWLLAMPRLKGKPFFYMLTIAIVFIIYAISDASGGNGGIAVFVFGLILGNVKMISKIVPINQRYYPDPSLALFQEEITFFIRTFFFVYLGLLVIPASLDTPMLSMSLAVLIVIILSRQAATGLMFRKDTYQVRGLVGTMLPRGLAAAILATLPAQNGIVLPYFFEIVLICILLTNVIATAGLFVFSRKKPPAQNSQKENGNHAPSSNTVAKIGKK